MGFKKIYRILFCKDCQDEFLGYLPQKYCETCRKDHVRYINKGQDSDTVRRYGCTDRCLHCGKEYIIAGGIQKYCPDCKHEIAKKRAREHYHKNKDKVLALQSQRRKLRKLKKVKAI